MEIKKVTSHIQTGIALVCGSGMILTTLLIMNKDYPLVGHDYRYFIPRLIDTDLHIRQNGLSIQWYTPSFGGGLPAFPNPQNIEYSLVQWLTYFIDPWSAILLSTAIISLIGYYFFYKFLYQKLELNWMASTLGAMFFIGNGFYIEHLIVGHLGYQLFPLSAVVIYALTDKRNKFLFNSSAVAIVIVLFIHQAGFYLFIILVLSLGMALPILFLYKPTLLDLKNMALIAITAVLLSMAMAGSKVYAVYALMRHFPREVFDSYNVSLLQALIGIITQLVGVMAFSPVILLTRHDPGLLSGAFSAITGSTYGIWEIDTGLSPLLIVFLLISLAGAFKTLHTSIKSKLLRPQVLSLIVLILAIWVTVEMALAKGMIYTLTRQLPMLKSLHVNVRFTAAFILPFVLLGVFQADQFFSRNPKPLYFYSSVLLTILCLLSFFTFSKEVHARDFDVNFSNALHKEIQRGMTFRVVDITDKSNYQGFAARSSLYRPYEPVFGYELESFAPEIQPGSVFEIRDGYFNMTNPASLVFPEINHLHLFERIKVREQDNLEIFLARGQPAWEIPNAQKAFDNLSLLTAVFCTGTLLVTKVPGIRFGNRKKNKVSSAF